MGRLAVLTGVTKNLAAILLIRSRMGYAKTWSSQGEHFVKFHSGGFA